MRLKEISTEVFQADEPIVKVSRREIEFLKERVKHAPRGRVRLCAHSSDSDLVHEMIIVLTQKTYIRPHRHFGKCESFHIIEGAVDVVPFDDAGEIKEIIEMGEPGSGKNFFYRLSTPLFHTLLIRSEILIIHETTTGPF
jgi:cupin fold WbuC family metalloprotein